MSKEIEKKEESEIVTIQDFKSMLIGMDLILGESWTPSEQQWTRIRSKLDALIETADRPVTRPNVPGRGPASVVPNLNVSDRELISSFPAVPVAVDVPIGMEPTGSALTPIPTTPATATPVGSDDNRVHRKDEFI